MLGTAIDVIALHHVAERSLEALVREAAMTLEMVWNEDYHETMTITPGSG